MSQAMLSESTIELPEAAYIYGSIYRDVCTILCKNQIDGPTAEGLCAIANRASQQLRGILYGWLSEHRSAWPELSERAETSVEQSLLRAFSREPRAVENRAFLYLRQLCERRGDDRYPIML